MAALVLVVVAIGPDGDLAPALAALPADRRVVVEPPGTPPRPLPDGVERVVDPEYRRAMLAARVRRDPGELIVVVMEDERPLPELAAALRALDGEAAPGRYAVERRVRFLGAEIGGDVIEVGWGGHATGTAIRLPGALVRAPHDVAATIARLEALASRARRDVAVGAADFVGRPLVAMARRLWRRRRAGVPGLVLSILETYGEVLAAAHAWERLGIRPRRSEHLDRVPPGFHVSRTPWGWLMVRDGTDDRLHESLLEATPEHVRGEPRAGGRGGVWTVTWNGAGRAVLRWYRRGGAIRHFLTDRYFGWAPRPIVELGLTEEARRRGIAAPEVLAARVDRLRAGWYRGAIVTREIPDAVTLAAALHGHAADPERSELLAAVGRAIRRLHDRGVHHRDLNATNLLLRRDADGWAVYFIDFDRADVRASVGTRARGAALRRLDRSLAKLAPSAAPFTARDAQVVRQAYDAPDDPAERA